MNKGIVLVIILAMSIFLAGCGQTQSTGKTFIGGTEGLRTTFLQGSPPETTTDGGTGGFSIIVKTENVGESPVRGSDGYVQIWGLDAAAFGSNIPDFKKMFSQQQGFGEELRGAVMNFDGTVLNGGVATVDFGNLKYQPTIQGNIQPTVWANICYKYKSKVTTQLCINSNIEQTLSSKRICEVEGEKNPQNSGSPIHVTSLKESYAGNNKIGITVTIAHVGNGDAFFKDTSIDCNDVESNSDRGKVFVKFNPVRIAGRDVTPQCQGTDNGYIRLFKDGSGQETGSLYCTIDTGTNTNVVEVPVDIELSYVYLQHLSQDIVIRHIGR